MENISMNVDPNYRLNPVLRELPENVIKNLLFHKLMSYEVKGRNECLFFQNDDLDPDSKVYFILNGQVRVKMKKDGEINEFTQEVKDSVVGEMALFHRAERSATCVAEVSTTFYTIKKSHFEKIFYSTQEIAFYIREIMLKILLSKFNETITRNRMDDEICDAFLQKEKELEEINRKMRSSIADISAFEVYKKDFQEGIKLLTAKIIAYS